MLNHLAKCRIRLHRGQALVATIWLTIAIMGFSAFAVDYGYLYSVRRHMQTASDAAAVAAANQLNVSAATDVTALNGFTNGSNNTTVTVTPTTNPSGYPSGTYYTVVVTQSVPTFFLRVLGYNSMHVSTTAMAGNVDGSSTLTALGGSGSGVTVDSGASITVGGSSSTQEGGCGVVSNAGLTNNGTITAPSVGVVTSVSGTTPAHTTTGIAPVTDQVASCVTSAINAGGISPNSCSFASTTKTGTYNCSKTQTITPKVYDGSGSKSSTACGYVCTKSNIRVTFNTGGGTCGNRISCGANDQTSYPISNTTCTLNSGTYQCSTSSGYGWGGSSATCSLEVGNNASGCTVTCNSGGSYTFLGNVSCSGSNTVNLQPGSYYGGITISGTSSAAPTVNFAPGTYVIGGGGLNCSGQCTLNGTGCTFYNTTDTSPLSSSAGPISIGPNTSDNVTCSLHAPTSGSCKGLLLCQDSAVSGSSGHGWWYGGGSGSGSQCSVQGCSGSTFDGAVYTPGAALKYCGSSSSSSSHGYTILSANSVELTSGATTQVSCDYTNLTNGMSPITTASLYK
jgi:hypothetical protein